MKKPFLLLPFFLIVAILSNAQNNADSLKTTDTLKQVTPAAHADDPANFLTRVEVFNELQHYDNDVYLNQTVLRTIVQIGKKFSTRIDVPFVHNSLNTSGKYKASGIGDISFRLLGFKVNENPRSAITTSLEVSLNTAQSPLLGTGKNLLIPMVSYSKGIPKYKMLTSVVLQQTFSIFGDKDRSNINFTKLQLILLKRFSRKTWVVLAPEWFIDYVHGGLSMNLRSRLTHAPKPRLNIWITPSIGVFGDFAGRYKWSADIGARYFIFRKKLGLGERIR